MRISNNYIQIEIKTTSVEEKDILIAQLYGMDFEFEEGPGWLKAFIPEADFNEKVVDNLFKENNITYSLSTILNKNWNAEWEAGFQPVRVDDFCCIRAGFHPPEGNVRFDIVITPQMSFGTGHHATTFMMLQAMRNLDWPGKKVADFGTGTGVLAILAEKMGAAAVWAIDNDDWSIANAADNFAVNKCERIRLERADQLPDQGPFDIILANINRNVILHHLAGIRRQLSGGGKILFSGLLQDDQPLILEAARKEGLRLEKAFEKDSWVCLVMTAS